MHESKIPTILVTRATGNVGSELTKTLSGKHVPFRVMVRSTKSAEAVRKAGAIDVVIGDFDDAESLARVLAGVERAFLEKNSSEHAEAQQIRFFEVASRAGVRHIVKLSQWAADPDSTLPQLVLRR